MSLLDAQERVSGAELNRVARGLTRVKKCITCGFDWMREEDAMWYEATRRRLLLAQQTSLSDEYETHRCRLMRDSPCGRKLTYDSFRWRHAAERHQNRSVVAPPASKSTSSSDQNHDHAVGGSVDMASPNATMDRWSQWDDDDEVDGTDHTVGGSPYKERQLLTHHTRDGDVDLPHSLDDRRPSPRRDADLPPLPVAAEPLLFNPIPLVPHTLVSAPENVNVGACSAAIFVAGTPTTVQAPLNSGESVSAAESYGTWVVGTQLGFVLMFVGSKRVFASQAHTSDVFSLRLPNDGEAVDHVSDPSANSGGDRTLLLSLASDAAVVVWDVSGRCKVRRIAVTFIPSAATFVSRNLNMIAVGFRNSNSSNLLRIFSVSTGLLVRNIRTHHAGYGVGPFLGGASTTPASVSSAPTGSRKDMVSAVAHFFTGRASLFPTPYSRRGTVHPQNAARSDGSNPVGIEPQLAWFIVGTSSGRLLLLEDTCSDTGFMNHAASVAGTASTADLKIHTEVSLADWKSVSGGRRMGVGGGRGPPALQGCSITAIRVVHLGDQWVTKTRYDRPESVRDGCPVWLTSTRLVVFTEGGSCYLMSFVSGFQSRDWAQVANDGAVAMMGSVFRRLGGGGGAGDSFGVSNPSISSSPSSVKPSYGSSRNRIKLECDAAVPVAFDTKHVEIRMHLLSRWSSTSSPRTLRDSPVQWLCVQRASRRDSALVLFGYDASGSAALLQDGVGVLPFVTRDSTDDGCRRILVVTVDTSTTVKMIGGDSDKLTSTQALTVEAATTSAVAAALRLPSAACDASNATMTVPSIAWTSDKKYVAAIVSEHVRGCTGGAAATSECDRTAAVQGGASACSSTESATLIVTAWRRHRVAGLNEHSQQLALGGSLACAKDTDELTALPSEVDWRGIIAAQRVATRTQASCADSEGMDSVDSSTAS